MNGEVHCHLEDEFVNPLVAKWRFKKGYFYCYCTCFNGKLNLHERYTVLWIHLPLQQNKNLDTCNICILAGTSLQSLQSRANAHLRGWARRTSPIALGNLPLHYRHGTQQEASVRSAHMYSYYMYSYSVRSAHMYSLQLFSHMVAWDVGMFIHRQMIILFSTYRNSIVSCLAEWRIHTL